MLGDHLVVGRCQRCDHMFAYRPRLMSGKPLCRKCLGYLNRERRINLKPAIDIDPMAYQPIKERRK
jgi:hypothetical protein